MTEEVRDLLTGDGGPSGTEDIAVGADSIRPQSTDHAEDGGPPRASAPTSETADNTNSEFRTPNSELDFRAHLASLAVQAESLRAEIPDFNLRQALQDPDFLRMTSPAVGLSVRRAWYALHGEQLRRAAAERSALALTESLASGALRPREGGRGLAAGTLSESDPHSWSRQQRETVRRRVYEAAARGEKIYP